ncbi:HEXXH motif domain-containing protein [Streptomyces roseirectus]|uniref:HEXXH motif domain-containing protein n=1 Tax=Streptomyces roseirectus TaxID=2768066 RepID=A0A7H0IQY7_9ACTN|nr:HEXXH motif domain-containing protein [Streptomyces roseirectus]QNP75203.1 HEXXH motif domain-containing protein [Streptomyces roseirectus]
MTSLDTPPHRLARTDLDALLRGEGGADAVAPLLAGERSWRLLLVRALADAMAPLPDTLPGTPLPPPADGWELLRRAWRAAPVEVERLLLYPAVGTWAAHTLRRVRGTVASDTPLWVDAGHLHAVAASAAVLAGLDFRCRVAVRDGWAVLPGIGGARAGEPVVEVVAEAGVVRVGSVRVGAEGWHALRELRADGCVVAFDDLDPYRGLRGRLTPRPVRSAGRWSGLFAEAWRILADDPETARAVASGLRSVVPRPRSEPYRPHSASSGDAFGAVVASEPDDAEQFACTLVHESQHHRLSAFMHLFTLYEDGGAERFHAPWRDDPRPLGGLLQGVYAFTGVAAFWRRRPGDLARFEYVLWREQTLSALAGVRDAARLTPLGRDLVAALTERLTAWRADPVPARIERCAALAAADHRATWRALHVRPPADSVARAARAHATTAGVPLPAPDGDTVVPAPVPRGLDTRAVLVRRMLAGEDPGTVAGAVEGARAEDVALVTGDPAVARAAFTARILRGPDPDAWSGLGLALDAQGHPAAQVLLERPEFVLAVHRELGGGTDPVELAAACVIPPATGRSPG